MRVTKEKDALSTVTLFELNRVVEEFPGVSLHGSLPCTPLCTWPFINPHLLGQKFKHKLHKERMESRKLLAAYMNLVAKVLNNGGHVSFEWPKYCAGWLLPELQNFMRSWNIYTVSFDGCAVGVKSSKGRPIKKPLRIITSSPKRFQKCKHRRGEHYTATGKETTWTQT